jgi:hypothetical protein
VTSAKDGMEHGDIAQGTEHRAQGTRLRAQGTEKFCYAFGVQYSGGWLEMVRKAGKRNLHKHEVNY